MRQWRHRRGQHPDVHPGAGLPASNTTCRSRPCCSTTVIWAWSAVQEFFYDGRYSAFVRMDALPNFKMLAESAWSRVMRDENRARSRGCLSRGAFAMKDRASSWTSSSDPSENVSDDRGRADTTRCTCRHTSRLTGPPACMRHIISVPDGNEAGALVARRSAAQRAYNIESLYRRAPTEDRDACRA